MEIEQEIKDNLTTDVEATLEVDLTPQQIEVLQRHFEISIWTWAKSNAFLSSVSPWIAVSDRLPEDGERVLCFHYYSRNYFISWRTHDCYTNEPKWYNGDQPTHWMPLPEWN